jgi:hypothetical protein
VLRCKILILLGLFAEYREQRGYGRFAEAISFSAINFQLVARRILHRPAVVLKDTLERLCAKSE